MLFAVTQSTHTHTHIIINWENKFVAATRYKQQRKYYHNGTIKSQNALFAVLYPFRQRKFDTLTLLRSASSPVNRARVEREVQGNIPRFAVKKTRCTHRYNVIARVRPQTGYAYLMRTYHVLHRSSQFLSINQKALSIR